MNIDKLYIKQDNEFVLYSEEWNGFEENGLWLINNALFNHKILLKNKQDIQNRQIPNININKKELKEYLIKCHESYNKCCSFLDFCKFSLFYISFLMNKQKPIIIKKNSNKNKTNSFFVKVEDNFFPFNLNTGVVVGTSLKFDSSSFSYPSNGVWLVFEGSQSLILDFNIIEQLPENSISIFLELEFLSKYCNNISFNIDNFTDEVINYFKDN